MAEQVNENVLAEKRKKLVLVVDGNPRDAHTTGMLLQNFGYSVSTVKSAEEALELISIVVPSLIVMEFILPGMNGIDLLGRLKQTPAFSALPAIILTSHPDPSGRTRCLASGCSVYLRKPAQPDELYRAVQSAVEPTPRQNVRVETFLKASVDGSGTGAEFVTMLSDQGLFVKTLHPKPAGTTHGVSFILNRKIIKVQAQVLYAYRFGEGPGKEPGMGMKFVTIEPADLAMVQAYVQSRVSAGTPQDKTR
jgi:CheY-like chemotaxis protein